MNLKSDKTGMALIEMLFSMFVLILIGLAIFLFQRDVFSLHQIISGNLTIQYEARAALKLMTAELRSASPSSLGAYPLSQLATSSIIFYSNTDDDSLKERVRYFLDGTTLKKGKVKPSGQPLAYNLAAETVSDVVHNVQNATTSIFEYYDSNYDGTLPALSEPIDVSAVRLVRIYLVIDDSIDNPKPVVLTTQVSLRNLKDNL